MRNLAILIFAGFAFAACSNTWPGPVPIDEALWEIDLQLCGSLETNNLQWAQGTVTNISDETSPFYQTASRAEYTDGTSGQLDTGELIPPLEPNQSYDFSFVLGNSTDKEVVTCEVWIVDSVSNYTD